MEDFIIIVLILVAAITTYALKKKHLAKNPINSYKLTIEVIFLFTIYYRQVVVLHLKYIVPNNAYLLMFARILPSVIDYLIDGEKHKNRLIKNASACACANVLWMICNKQFGVIIFVYLMQQYMIVFVDIGQNSRFKTQVRAIYALHYIFMGLFVIFNYMLVIYQTESVVMRIVLYGGFLVFPSALEYLDSYTAVLMNDSF